MSAIELLSIGSSVLGGLFGRDSAKDQQRLSQQQFNAQMDQSIQRRVADAKKAGVHPLFALGASAGASPTMSTSQPDSSMQNALGSIARQLGVIQQNKASAARDAAEAAYLDAQRRKLEQTMNSEQDQLKLGGDVAKDALGRVVTPYDPTGVLGGRDPLVNVRPVDVPAQAKPGLRAGAEPSMVKVTLPGGREISVPNQDIFEEITSPSTLVGLGKFVLGMTDQEIAGYAKSLLNYVKRHGVKAGISDQQLIQRFKKYRDWAARGLEGGQRHYGSNW